MFRSYIHYNNQRVDGWWPPKFRLIICHWWKVRRLGDYPYQNVSKHIKTAINWSSISNVQTHPAIKLVSWLVYPTIIPLYHHKTLLTIDLETGLMLIFSGSILPGAPLHWQQVIEESHQRLEPWTGRALAACCVYMKIRITMVIMKSKWWWWWDNKPSYMKYGVHPSEFVWF